FRVYPIGILHTPFKSSKGTPIQPVFSDELGTATVFDDFIGGLESLDGFSHIYLFYFCHRAKSYSLKVKPYLDDREHGVFSTRSPSRPNPIGFSLVEMISIDENIISFRGADMLDETPLLDIKPYVTRFDHQEEATTGWLEEALKKQGKEKQADSRFEKSSTD
ncbi:MAG: tRNA (N6-threonylcarbamoyladenosine(37)-N6)-methyltransferase TrmO, partial [Candidatus Lokiarchaeota archaeon]|nr:tRNA (N6-threonylcarbamoyladenosine(37)-N6)-methyltransferase TrmO [Candidatus Lokiarchaeota archaeon]